MRTMIGKRIGPVPISLVAVLALAAFISAGLWLTPTGGAQAQEEPHVTITDGRTAPVTGTTSYSGDVTVRANGTAELDLGEVIEVAGGNAFAMEYATGTAAVTWVWDNGETTDALGAVTDPVIADGAFTFTLTAPAAFPTWDHDDDNTTPAIPVDGNVTVTISSPDGDDADSDRDETFTFKVRVVQNPIEDNGVEIANPSFADRTDLTEYPASGDCEVVTNGAAIASRGITLGPIHVNADGDTADDGESTTLGRLISGGDCSTTGDTVGVVFKNHNPSTTDQADANRIIAYSTGGADFKGVSPDLAKDGLTLHSISLEPETVDPVLGGEIVDEETITISKSMAKDGVVYIVGYTNETGAENTLYEDHDTQADSTTFRTNGEFVVEVRFLETPDMGKSVVNVPSQIGDTGTEMITVVVNDENGNPVPGTNVDLMLDSGTDSDITFSNNRQIALRTADRNGMVEETVKGLPKTGATRVGLTISFGGITETANLVRHGDPATVSISGYATCNKEDGCEAATADNPIVKATGGTFFVRAMATDEAGNNISDVSGTMLQVVGYDDASAGVIAVDSASSSTDGVADDPQTMDVDETNELTVETWWDMLSCAQMNDVVSPTSTEPAVGPDTSASPYCKMYDDLSAEAKMVVQRAAVEWFKVTINMDAEPAAADSYYAVKATAGEGDDEIASDKLGFSVLGGIHAIGLEGPDNLGGSQVVEGFTVTATNEDGGVPGNVEGTEVTISFSPADAASVVGTAGDNLNKIKLDAEGKATFTVLVTTSRLGSDNLIVIATVGDVTSTPLEVRHRQVSTGPTNSAPTPVGSVANVYMTIGDAPVTVTAGFADSDGDTLGYSASSDNTAVATAMSNGGGSVTVTAVGVGTANITVMASDGRLSATQTFMVTVSEVPDMSLGTASGLTATGGDGSVTLSWNPGNNATMYYVAGIAVMDDGSYDYSLNVWDNGELPEADENGMVMITVTNHSSESSDGMSLVNGTRYAFTVLSARMMDGALEWTDWAMPFAMATPMAAGSGGGISNPFG